jgi:hypothetical protein
MSAGVVPSNEYLIESAIISNNATTSVTFSNLSQYVGIYKHLQIIYSASANSEVRLGLRINGATSDYRSHGLFSRGTSIASYDSFSSDSGVFIRAAQDLDSSIQGGVIDILDAFSTSKNKTIKTLFGHSVPNNCVGITSGLFINTQVISSITLAPSDITSFENSTFVQNSRFSIYGVTA